MKLALQREGWKSIASRIFEDPEADLRIGKCRVRAWDERRVQK